MKVEEKTNKKQNDNDNDNDKHDKTNKWKTAHVFGGNYITMITQYGFRMGFFTNKF